MYNHVLQAALLKHNEITVDFFSELRNYFVNPFFFKIVRFMFWFNNQKFFSVIILNQIRKTLGISDSQKPLQRFSKTLLQCEAILSAKTFHFEIIYALKPSLLHKNKVS